MLNREIPSQNGIWALYKLLSIKELYEEYGCFATKERFVAKLGVLGLFGGVNYG